MTSQAELDHLYEKTKMGLFMEKNSGFLGSLLCKLKFSWVTEIRGTPINTAATDGIHLWWNPEFFLKLDAQERVFVLAHELWHVAYMHMLRLDGRDMERWNMATDYVINVKLVNAGYKMPKIGLLDRKYDNKSSEEVYDLLPKMPKGSCAMPDLVTPSGGQEAADKAATIMANVIGAMQASTMAGDQPGTIPGEVSEMVDKFLNPKLPWETLLFNFMNELTMEEYSFARPNRRYEDPILPGRNGRNGLEHLVYYLDVSGSITDSQVTRFNSEVKFIQEQLRPQKLTLVQFDTKIQKIDEFEQDDPFEKIVVVGRGGTALEPVYQHIKDHNPTAAIIFSDMWVNIPEEVLTLPVIWVCTNNKQAKVPFGKIIHIEEK